MNLESFEIIEKLLNQHKKLNDAHLYVVEVIKSLEKTDLGDLGLVNKKELIQALFAATANHFNPLKDKIRAEVGTIASISSLGQAKSE